MTRAELLVILRGLQHDVNTPTSEGWHVEADRALLDYINDPEITEAWGLIEKWFA